MMDNSAGSENWPTSLFHVFYLSLAIVLNWAKHVFFERLSSKLITFKTYFWQTDLKYSKSVQPNFQYVNLLYFIFVSV